MTVAPTHTFALAGAAFFPWLREGVGDGGNRDEVREERCRGLAEAASTDVPKPRVQFIQPG